MSKTHKTRAKDLDESWSGVILTSMEYVANNLRKKSNQFLMSVATVFLTVSLISFLDMMTKLAPIVALKKNISISGDYDI